jgi:hypothetical protein
MDRAAAVASSFFVIGAAPQRTISVSKEQKAAAAADLPFLSSQATVSRNSQFRNLTAQDRDMLGGIEYRALKVLLRIVASG